MTYGEMVQAARDAASAHVRARVARDALDAACADYDALGLTNKWARKMLKIGITPAKFGAANSAVRAHVQRIIFEEARGAAVPSAHAVAPALLRSFTRALLWNYRRQR